MFKVILVVFIKNLLNLSFMAEFWGYFNIIALKFNFWKQNCCKFN